MLFNHFAELVVPFAYFAPMPISGLAGLTTLFFHGWLFASGNFAFLGLLTMVLAISTIGDAWWKRILPIKAPELTPPGRAISYLLVALGIVSGGVEHLPRHEHALARAGDERLV